jgi:hypothetical protein
MLCLAGPVDLQPQHINPACVERNVAGLGEVYALLRALFRHQWRSSQRAAMAETSNLSIEKMREKRNPRMLSKPHSK